jgi:hypothetical protein
MRSRFNVGSSMSLINKPVPVRDLTSSDATVDLPLHGCPHNTTKAILPVNVTSCYMSSEEIRFHHNTRHSISLVYSL